MILSTKCFLLFIVTNFGGKGCIKYFTVKFFFIYIKQRQAITNRQAIRLCVLIMSHTSYRVNPQSAVNLRSVFSIPVGGRLSLFNFVNIKVMKGSQKQPPAGVL